jgi:hypothetical protein
VLDGFPRTKEQAVLFEKMVAGLDLEGELAYAVGASTLAPPPQSAFVSLHRQLTSCLDTVVILELENAELSIERAIGRRMDPESGRTFHLQFSPPPSNSPGLLERLVPMRSGSNDSEQIRTRMEAYLEAAPQLMKWFGRFQTLTHCIDSDRPLSELTEHVLAIAKTVEDCKAGAKKCQEAAAAASSAQNSAQAASACAQAAAAAAAHAAEELLLAKKAELEAQRVLNAPADVPKGSKKGKVNPAEEASAAEAIAAATKLLAAQASICCAEHLKAGHAAKEDAERHLAVALQCASEAEAAAASAQQARNDAERSAEAQATATAAAEAAAAAATAAKEASQRAAVAASNAAEVVAQAKSKLEDVDNGQSVDLTLYSGQDKSSKAQEDTALQGPPRGEHLDKRAASYLAALWGQLEGRFIQGMKAAFTGLRAVRDMVVEHCGQCCQHITAHLTRPCGQQAELTAFIVNYNSTDLDMLHLHDVQAELMLQADELQDRLWAMCDAKHAENQALVAEVTDEALGTEATGALSNHFVAMMQAEIDRFSASCWFAQDYSAVACELNVVQRGATFVDLSEKLSGELAPLLDAKTGMSFPVWLQVTGVPQTVQEAGKVALAAIALQERSTSAVPPEATASKVPAKASKGKQPAATVLPEAEAAALKTIQAMAEPILERERQIARARMQAIVARSAAHNQEVQEMLQSLSERLQTSVDESYKQGCEVVATAVSIIKTAIEAGTKLPHDLQLQPDSVVLDMGTLLLPPSNHKCCVATRPASSGAGLLGMEHLRTILLGIQPVRPHQYCSIQVLAELMHRLTSATREMPFPRQWPKATYKQMYDALSRYDVHNSGYLDWMHVLISLILLAFPLIPTSPPSNFAEAAKALHSADRDHDGKITEAEWMGCNLWFQAVQKYPGCAQDLEAGSHPESNESDPPTTDFTCEIARELKKLLWCMFSVVAQPTSSVDESSVKDLMIECGKSSEWTLAGSQVLPGGSKRLMDIELPLLYLAADRDRMLAMRKAYAVLTQQKSRKSHLSEEKLLKLLYPHGTEAGKDIFKVPYNAEEIHEMAGKISCNEGQDNSITVTPEQLVYSVHGARLLSACAPQYELRDLYLDMWRVMPTADST